MPIMYNLVQVMLSDMNLDSSQTTYTLLHESMHFSNSHKYTKKYIYQEDCRVCLGPIEVCLHFHMLKINEKDRYNSG